MPGAFETDRLGLGSQGTDADGVSRLREHLLPLLDSAEDERDEFRSPKLTAPWVYLDDGLVLFSAQHDHVVIRRDDDLVGLPSVVEHHCVR